MAMRRAKNQRRRYNRKGQKKARILRAPAAKKYTYDFNLLPQLLLCDPATGGWTIPINAQNGQKPLLTGAANFTQLSNATGLTNVADLALSASFKFSDVANFSQYQILYDAYKINSISMTIEYLNNSVGVGTVGTMPTLYVYNDQDDAVVPPSVQSIIGKTGFKRFQFGNNSRTKFSYKWRPTNATLLGGPASTAITAGIGKSSWLNCANVGADVLHYSLKMILADVSTFNTLNSVNAFRISWKYNISFRSPLNAS